MLYKSGVNLEEQSVKFIENNNDISLFSAYIKINELEKINASKHIKQIVVRWEIKDLCVGASDIELYQYCKDNGIKLFRNTRIHLKAFWNNEQSVLFGSANVSNRGLGEKGKYNYELNGLAPSISIEDSIYLNQIISNSEYVTDELYNDIIKLVEETETPTLTYPDLETKKSTIDYFLISQLPMSFTVLDLFHVYSSDGEFNSEEINCAAHDIALFEIPFGLSNQEFIDHLKNSFNSHPFILSLKSNIKDQEECSLHYGGVVRWIQENTTTVPTPRSWELKEEQLVNALYDWICILDSDYSWSRPRHSQVIYYRPI